MKRFALLAVALAGMAVCTNGASADWKSCHYGGYQPWWNIFAKRNCLSAEEERLQRFWHDYYNSLQRYYGMLDNIDWVSYYKNHGYQINSACGGGPGGCGPTRIQFAPVFVSPTMQWAVPNSCLSGAPTGAPCPPMGAFPGLGMGGPGMGGPAMGMGGPGMGGPGMGMGGPGMAMGGYPPH